MRRVLLLTAVAALLLTADAAAVPVPRKARAVGTAHPDHWIGTGTPRS
jgi:hypothetical protein